MKVLGVDSQGIQKVMRKSDYMADMSGQFALGLVGNLVGQLTYFYTDKVGLAVGGVGIVMAIAKFVDALTDVWFGNVVEQSKGGNEKYYKWMLRMMVPMAAILILLFTVPIQMGQVPALIYVLVTNVLLTAVAYTLISTPFAAAMIVRTKSQDERSNMGIFRAIGSYLSGMIMVIVIIPITNALGGTQNAWIKFGVILALVVFLCLLLCYRNGSKAIRDLGDNLEVEYAEEGDKTPFKEAMGMLFRNKYWVIVLLFNVITAVTNAISAVSSTYYCKWIFGNDNLVALIGGVGFAGTIVGFAISKPIINKLGVKGAINFGLLGTVVAMIVRCFAPNSIVMFTATGVISSIMQMPLMCLYGVLLGMAVDYNEYKYDNKLVAISSGAVGFGGKVGSGIGSVVLSLFLVLGSYDASLSAATTSMKYSIYGFSNFLPIAINLLMFFVFRGFDLEEKLPAMRAEVEARHAK
mgnify:FL=1